MKEIDDVIDEIRASRCRMSKDCGHDTRRLIQYLQGFNERYAEQIRRYEEMFGPVATTRDAKR